MPRKFAETDRVKWLEAFESGKSQKSIARDAGCVVRTIVKGLEDARRRRDAALARTDLVKDALRKHQDGLMQALDDILCSVTLPVQDLAPLSWRTGPRSVFSPGEGSIERGGARPKQPESGDITERQLLREHLKNDPLLKALAQWRKLDEAVCGARSALQLKTVSTIERKTGYKVLESGEGLTSFVYSCTAGDIIFKAALCHAFNFEGLDLAKDIVTEKDGRGVVAYRNMILAEAPEREEKTKTALLAALEELKASPEIVSLVKTSEALEEATPKTRRAVQGIKLLGMVPGQCQICRRLGM